MCRDERLTPKFMGLATLAKYIDCSERAIENWAQMGTFPAPYKQGGKRLWSWKEVEQHLAPGKVGEQANQPVDLCERIRNGTRRAAAGGRS